MSSFGYSSGGGGGGYMLRQSLSGSGYNSTSSVGMSSAGGGNSMTPRSSMSAPIGSFLSAKNSPKSRQERQERQTNFKVVVRVRPPLQRELSGDLPFQNIVAVDEREQCITVSENLEAVLDQDGSVLANPGPYSTHSYVFDYVYDQSCSQRKVYDTTARGVVDSALEGYNATIFAYGQTGTGKTFTMEGFNQQGNIEARGIIPRAIEQVFGHIQRYASPRMRFLVRASYLQIYNEQISDLLKPERHNLQIREDKRRGIFVDGLSEWVVRSPAEIYGLMERGGAIRATGETKMNKLSSRSHAVFIVIAEQSLTTYVDESGHEMTAEEFQKFMHGRGVRREQEMVKLDNYVRQSFKVGKLNLVDLAGSERVKLSGATGQRLEESKQINKSLAVLGNVISALTDVNSHRKHIPYRDSKLTRMLADSLGGNCKTTMMAMISPAFEAMQESISTLNFANRAKNIRNEARVNEDLDQKSLLRKYERELKKLRAELEERNKNVVDKRRVLELEEQRKRAEADKMAAIRALEARSQEFMHEKEQKKKLEQRIAQLMDQVIRGDSSKGNGDGNTPGQDNAQMQMLMKEQQEKLTKEYEFKLADLERERESIEEEKAQVDRYKQLLLKQRDIMIALTQRLVERDEQIMALQDELDAYDRHHKELEEKLDEKTAKLIKFQRISMEINTNSPYKNEELNQALASWSRDEELKSGGATELPLDSGDGDGGVSSGAIQSEQRILIESQKARIEELERIVDQQKNQHNNSMHQNVDTKAMMQLKEENEILKQQNIKLQSEVSQSVQRGGSDTNVAKLQAKCATMQREREAVQTIMEQKIKSLVQNVAQSAAQIMNDPSAGNSSTGHSLTRDLNALQRLVKASVAALKNAAAADTNDGAGNVGRSGSVATTVDANIAAESASSASSGTDTMLPRATGGGWGAKDSYYIAGDAARR